MIVLVLSLFPGIGMLDMAFEEEGFCIVRGPDLLWGGDIKRFHPPAGKFDGVIGGPPCQAFSRLRSLVEHVYGPDKVAENLIPEFARCVQEARPSWWLMENVPGAPAPVVTGGYGVSSVLVRDVWAGGATSRMRRFTFGSTSFDRAKRFHVETLALHAPDPLPAVLSSGGKWVPVRVGGNGKPKRKKVRRADGRETSGYVYGAKTSKYFRDAVIASGLPSDFDLPGMTVAGKIKAVGNGVPLALGRAVAKAVKRALADTEVAA